jgi:hypothetical protein
MTKTILITGSTELSEEDFNKYYVPKIGEIIKSDVFIVVGGASGCDHLAKLYLADKIPSNHITVYDKGDQNHSEICVNQTLYKFQHINGFISYPERDQAMIDIADDIIGFIYQYAGGGSGTMQNIFIMEEKKIGRNLRANEIVLLTRKHTMDPFVDGMASLVANTLAPKFGKSVNKNFMDILQSMQIHSST